MSTVTEKISTLGLSLIHILLMLTAKSNEEDKVLGLRLGADDYLTKPFSINELTARVHSLIRRYTTLNPAFSEETDCICLKDMTIDLSLIHISLAGEGKEEARACLIEHNLRLVVYIAKKFDNTGVGVEDLISIGTIGLIKAINTFDPVKKIKLATYASRCIENEILMYLRRNSKTKLEVSIDEPLNVDWDGNEPVSYTHLDVYKRQVPRTSTIALTNATLKYGLQIAGKGLEQACKENDVIYSGINTYDGKLTCKNVADSFNVEHTEIKELF